MNPQVMECLNRHDGKCDGEVKYRIAMSGTGRSFPRCDHHFQARWATQQRLSRTYDIPITYDGSSYEDTDY